MQKWKRVGIPFWLGVTAWVAAACATAPNPREEARVTQAQEIPWIDLASASGPPSGYNWSRAVSELPVEVERIDRVLRNRSVFRQKGLGFGHLMLGSGAVYPYHSHASLEAYHVLSGEAEWTVDGETRRVGPGTSIYHAPYADHRWVTTSAEPLRVVWAQWVPDGDRSGLIADGVRRRGGASTGDFFPGERRSRPILVTEMFSPPVLPVEGSLIAQMKRSRLEVRLLETKRPAVRTFVDSVGIPWNTKRAGIRWRAVLTLPDLEWGHLEVHGPGIREIPASAAPGLLHVLSGRAAIRASGGPPVEVTPGTTFGFWPGEDLSVEFAEDAGKLRAIWVRWSPRGDLGYWARDYFLVEPVKDPPREASLPKDVLFFPEADFAAEASPSPAP